MLLGVAARTGAGEMGASMLRVSRKDQVGSAGAAAVKLERHGKRAGHDNVLYAPAHNRIFQLLPQCGDGEGVEGHTGYSFRRDRRVV